MFSNRICKTRQCQFYNSYDTHIFALRGDIDIDKAILENIDIYKDTFENIDINIDKDILGNIDINMGILENIDIDID